MFNTFRQIFILANYVIVEALRTRFFIVITILLAIGFGLALFLGQIAIIEGQSIQSSLLAAFLRISAIYVVSLFVITSVVREFNDHTIMLWFSLPIPRSVYFFGKLSGFFSVACVITVFFSAILILYANIQQVGLWAISLLCELLIVTTVSMLCVLTFHQTIQAFSAVLGFYILARSIDAIQLMTYSPLLNSDSWSDQFVNGLTRLLATLLPNFENFTPSEWLVYNTGNWENLSPIIVQTMIYVTLLIAMSLFDLYRKNL
jgi:Cu-processing system permease protein